MICYCKCNYDSVEYQPSKSDGEAASAFKSQTARFTLVDLAGAESMEASHGGEVDRAGAATNLGLLVLGRVITALAEQRESEYVYTGFDIGNAVMLIVRILPLKQNI